MASKEQKIYKKGFWQNELRSLGIEPKQNKEELNDDVELQDLADRIKLSMHQDHKRAYSLNGDEHEEEVQSTIH
jgi:hypothetical protein